MPQKVDLEIAQQLMLDAISFADDPQQSSDPDFVLWKGRIQAYSELVKEAGYTTTVALLGGALIAKGTNPHVDVMSIKARNRHPGAYNARGPVENVLYPASRLHGFDIGSTSKNPLNGETFRHDSATELEIKGKGRDLVNPLIALLHEVSLLPGRDTALRALAAYVHVRRGFVPAYDSPPPGESLATAAELTAAITGFVSANSEGGGRAQVATGGLFDAVYGYERVRLGKTNEPDRNIAGDVLVWEAQSSNEVVLAVEVRDKPVSLVDLLAVVSKLQRTRVHKGVVVAVAADQRPIPSAVYEQHASERGIRLRVLESWGDLVGDMLLWADRPESRIVPLAVSRIRERIMQMQMPQETVVAWDAVTIKSRAPSDPGAEGAFLAIHSADVD